MVLEALEQGITQAGPRRSCSRWTSPSSTFFRRNGEPIGHCRMVLIRSRPLSSAMWPSSGSRPHTRDRPIETEIPNVRGPTNSFASRVFRDANPRGHSQRGDMGRGGHRGPGRTIDGDRARCVAAAIRDDRIDASESSIEPTDPSTLPGRQILRTGRVRAPLAIADEVGVGTAFRRIISVCREAGLHPRPDRLSVMFAPPSHRRMFLFTVWPQWENGGSFRVWKFPVRSRAGCRACLRTLRSRSSVRQKAQASARI